MAVDEAKNDESNAPPSSAAADEIFSWPYIAMELAYTSAGCLIYLVLIAWWKLFIGGGFDMIAPFAFVIVFNYYREKGIQSVVNNPQQKEILLRPKTE